MCLASGSGAQARRACSGSGVPRPRARPCASTGSGSGARARRACSGSGVPRPRARPCASTGSGSRAPCPRLRLRLRAGFPVSGARGLFRGPHDDKLPRLPSLSDNGYGGWQARSCQPAVPPASTRPCRTCWQAAARARHDLRIYTGCTGAAPVSLTSSTTLVNSGGNRGPSGVAHPFWILRSA